MIRIIPVFPAPVSCPRLTGHSKRMEGVGAIRRSRGRVAATSDPHIHSSPVTGYGLRPETTYYGSRCCQTTKSAKSVGPTQRLCLTTSPFVWTSHHNCHCHLCSDVTQLDSVHFSTLVINSPISLIGHSRAYAIEASLRPPSPLPSSPLLSPSPDTLAALFTCPHHGSPRLQPVIVSANMT